MNNVFSSKSFMARFGAPMSTGPAKIDSKKKSRIDILKETQPFIDKNRKDGNLPPTSLSERILDYGNSKPKVDLPIREVPELNTEETSFGEKVLGGLRNVSKFMMNAKPNRRAVNSLLTGPAKATKEVTETFDKNGDGTPFQKEDLAMLRKQAPAKKRSKRLADRSQAAFDKDKVVKAKQTKAIKEGKDKKAKRLSKKRTRLQQKDIKLQRKSFEKASEGK